MSRGHAALLASLVLAPGCGGSSEAEAAPDPVTWPAGTVLAVDDVPILAEDVTPWAAAVGELYPEYTLVHRRRLALTNVLIPRAAARDAFTEAREAARRECEAAYAEIEERAAGAHRIEATWRDLGLELWDTARGLPPGTWSKPTELLGRWVVVRLEERTPGRVPSEDKLNIRWLQFPYLDPSESSMRMQAEVDASRLVIVDPAWSETVPEAWKRRMRGEE